MRTHLRITGQVQGVSFRYYAQQRARELGLGGWIRNCSDGSVEAEVQGGQDSVERFCDWARTGPPSARVDQVHVETMRPEEGATRFRIEG